MMEGLRTWLLGITGAAFLLALAEGLLPEGTGRRAARLAGGLLLFLILFRPVTGVDLSALPRQLEEYSREERAAPTLAEENQRLTAAIIEEELAAYIVEKAAALGARCGVEVTCREEENGLQVPDTIRLTGQFPEGVSTQLSQMLQEELGIPVQRQSYIQEAVP